MGIEPTEDDSHRPPLVLKTRPATRSGRATAVDCSSRRSGVQRESADADALLHSSYPPRGGRCQNGRVQEAHLELTSLRCPRCAGQLVLRVLAEERGRSALLSLDSACIACGVSPWEAPDQRSIVFTPGASIGEALGGVPQAGLAQDAETRLAAAQARIDSLLRRCASLEHSLAASQRNLQRVKQSDVELALRAEISHLEGELAAARAEVRRSEEATRGEVGGGKRPIEIE